MPSGASADGASASSSSASAGIKILKWVRVPDGVITFPKEQDVLAEDRIADDAAIIEAPVQSIHNAPAVSTPAGGSISSIGGGLGTIAPKEPTATSAPAPTESSVTPASAIPVHVTQTFSEPTTGTNTTGETTPTESVANTPAPADENTHQPPALDPSEPATATATGSNTPQVQPQVETQLHDQLPPTAPENDSQTLAVLAAGAEAEQLPAAQDETLVSTDPNASIPATKFQDLPPPTDEHTTQADAYAGASASARAGDDVDMKDA